MKSEIKAYKVVVDSKVARATLICVTYRISLSAPQYGAEFYQLVTNFDNSVFNIPFGSHTFSFQEELRLFSTAAGIAPDNRQNIEDWIKAKMIEAYGEGNKIFVENFPAD